MKVSSENSRFLTTSALTILISWQQALRREIGNRHTDTRIRFLFVAVKTVHHSAFNEHRSQRRRLNILLRQVVQNKSPAIATQATDKRRTNLRLDLKDDTTIVKDGPYQKGATESINDAIADQWFGVDYAAGSDSDTILLLLTFQKMQSYEDPPRNHMPNKVCFK